MATLLPSRSHTPRRLLRSLAERLLTPHGIDRYTELVDPMLVRDELRGEVVAVRHQTADTVTLTLRTSAAWPGFCAGQHVRIAVDIDGVRRRRCYSPANGQHRADGTIELTIKVDPAGLVSDHLYRHARPGLVLGLSEADGDFRLPDQRPSRLVLLSGGSGITPVLAMLRTLAQENYAGQAAFVHYAASPADVPYRTELAALTAAHPNLTVAFGHPSTGGGDVDGYFGTEHLDTVAPWWRHAQTYACGPPELLTAVRDVYDTAQRGEHLHTEQFAPPVIDADAADATGRVRFARSGVTADNSGKPLLEQAEEVGLTPEHGCRMGICFSCTTVKTSGCVRNAVSGEHNTEPDEPIQLCVSVPVGDVAIDC